VTFEPIDVGKRRCERPTLLNETHEQWIGADGRTMSKENGNKLQLIILVIVLVVVAGALLGIPQDWTNWIVQWLISAFIGTVFSTVAASIVEAFTGDLLKTILISIEITDEVKFSISLFAIATIIVKYWLFHQF